MSVRCLTMIDIDCSKVSRSMSSAPISSRVRAQSIDSAIEGGFFRSSARIIRTTSTMLPRQRLGQLGRVQADDLHLPLQLGVVEPEVEAAPLQRLGQLARVVRGEDDDRHRRRRDLAQLGDRDLEVGEQLEQHRLELLVGLVDLVDQQHHWLGAGDRLHQRALEQELLVEDVAVDVLPAVLAAGLDPQQLLAVVPLVQRLGLVEPLVALQADQLAPGGARERLGQLGLADPRRTLDQDRLLKPLGEEGDQRGGLVGEVADLRQRVLHLGDRAIGHGGDDNPALCSTSPCRSPTLLPHSAGPYIALVADRLRDRHPRPPQLRPAGWSPPA